MPQVPANRGSADQSDVAPARGPELLPSPLPADPFPLFQSWFDHAVRARTQPNPNAMVLATADAAGRPSARVVLCKAIDPAAGHIVFYTNYRGRKARDLDQNPRAAATFHWDALDRQVRIEGAVVQSPEAESDAYFASRPWLSRIGAWASDQSEAIADRPALVGKLHETLRRFGLDPANLPPPDAKVEIPRPAHWGGFRLIADRVELWCSGEGRLHDRAAWVRPLAPAPSCAPRGTWTAARLQP